MNIDPLAHPKTLAESETRLTNARLRVNDWHACSTQDELVRWRIDQEYLIVCAKDVARLEIEAQWTARIAQVRALEGYDINELDGLLGPRPTPDSQWVDRFAVLALLTQEPHP